MKRPKYFYWCNTVYAVYSDGYATWHSDDTWGKFIQTQNDNWLKNFNAWEDAKPIALVQVRSIFPNIKAHKRNDTVALGTEPATNPVSQQ